MQPYFNETTKGYREYNDNVTFADDNPNDMPNVLPLSVIEGFTLAPSVRPSKYHDLVNGEWVLVRDTAQLQAAKDTVWNAVKQKRTDIMLAGVEFEGNIFQSRDVDMNTAQAAITSLTTWPKNRPALDNTIVSLTKADAIAILTFIIDLYYAADVNAQALRADINAAADETELAAIDINVEWPTVPYTGA